MSIVSPRVVLAVLWIVAGGAIGLMLWQGVRGTERYEGARHLVHAVYALALLWYLARSGPPASRLPEIGARLLPRRRYGAWIPVVGIVLLGVLTAVSDDGFDLVMLALIAATPWILLAWRRDVRLRQVLQGVALAMVAGLAAWPAVRHGFLARSTVLLLAGLAAPMYVAGALLFARTGLGGAQLMAGRWVRSAGSFLRGCLLCVPLGLANAAAGSPGSEITWVSEWWMPLSLPWFSALAEEVWFRLLLVGLCFFLLRPALRGRPQLAVAAAVGFAGITFGLGHERTLDGLLITGLLYGVPMAALFARRDWEHAVGAHYMVNLIPWLAVLLES